MSNPLNIQEKIEDGQLWARMDKDGHPWHAATPEIVIDRLEAAMDCLESAREEIAELQWQIVELREKEAVQENRVRDFLVEVAELKAQLEEKNNG